MNSKWSVLLVGLAAALAVTLGAIPARGQHCATAIAKPYVAPYHAPAYHEAAVVVLKVPVVPVAYWSVADPGKDETIRELLSQNRTLIERLTAAQPPVPVAAPQPHPQAQAAPKGIAGVVQSRCVQCHGGPLGTKGGLDLSDLARVTPAGKVAILRAVHKGTMPKGGKLSEAEEREFEAWAFGP